MMNATVLFLEGYLIKYVSVFHLWTIDHMLHICNTCTPNTVTNSNSGRISFIGRCVFIISSIGEGKRG